MCLFASGLGRSVAGPLVGGLLVDSRLGWRACFYVGIPFAAALIVLQRTLHLPTVRRDVRVDLSPTASGLRTIPMVAGLAVSSLVVGRLVSATGRWKRFIVGGSVTATVGMALLSTIDARTPGVFVAAAMALFGLGIGATLQNLVLSVQNTVPVRQLGAATATVSFFRSLGGATGVSVLGAVLAHSVTGSVAVGLGRIGAPALPGGSAIPDVRSLPGPVAAVVRQAYGDGVALSFPVATPLLLLAVVAILAIREVPLGSRSGAEQAAEVAVTGGAGGKQAVAASP